MHDQHSKHLKLPDDFKGKLNWLIENYKKSNGDKWNDREIAEAIDSTRGYVYRLRTDPNVNNPSLEVLKRLGKFFGVGLRFFDDDFDPARVNDPYETMIGTELSMRMVGLSKLSPEDQLTILHIIDNAIKASQASGNSDEKKE